MKFLLLIDESGNYDLNVHSHDDNYLAICGVLTSSNSYRKIDNDLKDFKKDFVGNKDLVLHSRDIRNKSGDFSFLQDDFTNKKFLTRLSNIIEKTQYRIICPVIDKGELRNSRRDDLGNVYHLAVTFLLERVRYVLQEFRNIEKQLTIVIESRNPKEDKRLKKHIEGTISYGTMFVNAKDFDDLNIKIFFNTKKDNINGLQFADLFAYPILRHVIYPQQENFAYNLLLEKIHKKHGKVDGAGIKIFPK
ncbi:DUF3800 domain-containing protein [Mucilaginibacter rubeus]|uniref:DUF3800 domain-containing protein n=1 Tax=Mucilaginibacter rubeus TaxID=2027860 RepID=A0AAE6JK13_9SPHI|nr:MULTISPECIES: DUF3800 domain-containing protein [Mucilaginibacter]QEM07359.1 DUF3800 domain-containing protein [Mucilaginibacter rubeus]QEM19812.1 DUF3800 domain-containing protein [Mucilaginibacter gossypii]QTE43485.1 DUF3800 domain-containing protein [Mucilaginibacter rubeus]QTE50085.1 DUF3800 domain-containing protein [Mucilaginibacter rubeus]QTE55174.1 DUF3800 domain-containing protein [Mucilaginibacter rubeus]